MFLELEGLDADARRDRLRQAFRERIGRALGAEDPHQFRANQGSDLLTFFGGVFERAMRRWLA